MMLQNCPDELRLLCFFVWNEAKGVFSSMFKGISKG